MTSSDGSARQEEGPGSVAGPVTRPGVPTAAISDLGFGCAQARPTADVVMQLAKRLPRSARSRLRPVPERFGPVALSRTEGRLGCAVVGRMDANGPFSAPVVCCEAFPRARKAMPAPLGSAIVFTVSGSERDRRLPESMRGVPAPLGRGTTDGIGGRRP